MPATATALMPSPVTPIWPWKRAPEKPALLWDRSEALALSSVSCRVCFGSGVRLKGSPCQCVTRKIFRICLERYYRCRCGQGVSGGVSMEKLDCGTRSFRCYGRKDEEFIADFELAARRTLNDQEFRLFQMHYLWGAQYTDCMRSLGLDKGQVFHLIYRVAHLVGRACRETRPYALFPLREYFTR